MVPGENEMADDASNVRDFSRDCSSLTLNNRKYRSVLASQCKKSQIRHKVAQASLRLAFGLLNHAETVKIIVCKLPMVQPQSLHENIHSPLLDGAFFSILPLGGRVARGIF